MGSRCLSCPNSVLRTLKSVQPGLKPGQSRLSLLTSKVFMAFDLYSSKVIMSQR